MSVRGSRVAHAVWRWRGTRWGWLGVAMVVGGAVLVFLSFSGSTDSSGERAATYSARQEQSPAPGGGVPAGDDEGEPNAPAEPQGDREDKRDRKGAAASQAQGSIHEVADVEPGAVADPVKLDDTAAFGNGVQAQLASIKAIRAEARLPGEFSGPAVVVTVEVANESSQTINLDTVTVDLTFGDRLSAYTVTDPERVPLSGDLAARDTTTGDYVFTLPPEERADVQVRIKYSAETPTVVFTGSVADE